MRVTLRNLLRGIIGLTLLAAATTCTDKAPLTSPPEVKGGESPEPARNSSAVVSVTCRADVTAGEVSCGEVPVVDESGAQRVILGGQMVYVWLLSQNPSYDGGTEIFQADVRVANLIPQGLGSADGLTVTGIRIFHHSGPTVTGGAGTVDVANADGTGTFTGSNQPYHFYTEYLPAFDGFTAYGTSWKTWQWNVEQTVTTFEFEVYVDADIVNTDGMVLMSSGALLMSVGGGTEIVTGSPVDYVGRSISKTVTYTSAEPTIASVDVNTGEITAVSSGVVDIIGSTGGPEADGVTRVTVDPPTAGFDINFHFLTSMTSEQLQAFTDAAAKWSSLIIGDLPTELVELPIIACGGIVNEYVDDLTINVAIAPIDGVGGTLGQASPCWVRSGAGGLPAFGVMQFDSDDVQDLIDDSQFDDVVLHEMGHVLGIGGMWDWYGLLADSTGALDDCPATPNDPYFSGGEAIAAFDSTGGGSYAGGYRVPAEDGFGDGTRCVHWRESVMNTELMTGFSEAPGTTMPLSAVTVKSLMDMGYTMATSGWDAYTCPNCAPPAGAAPRSPAEDGGFELVNDVMFLPLYSRDATGRVIEVRPGRQ